MFGKKAEKALDLLTLGAARGVHEVWSELAAELLKSEAISQGRRERWEVLLVPFDDIPDDGKNYIMNWAQRIVARAFSEVQGAEVGEELIEEMVK